MSNTVVNTKYLACAAGFHQECAYKQKINGKFLVCSCDCHLEANNIKVNCYFYDEEMIKELEFLIWLYGENSDKIRPKFNDIFAVMEELNISFKNAIPYTYDKTPGFKNYQGSRQFPF